MQLLISFFNHKRFAKCSCQTGHDIIIIIITFMYLALILDIMTSVMEYQFRQLGCYRKIASSNTSCLKAHVGFFRLLKKGIFGLYVHLVPA